MISSLEWAQPAEEGKTSVQEVAKFLLLAINLMVMVTPSMFGLAKVDEHEGHAIKPR